MIPLWFGRVLVAPPPPAHSTWYGFGWFGKNYLWFSCVDSGIGETPPGLMPYQVDGYSYKSTVAWEPLPRALTNLSRPIIEFLRIQVLLERCSKRIQSASLWKSKTIYLLFLFNTGFERQSSDRIIAFEIHWVEWSWFYIIDWLFSAIIPGGPPITPFIPP